jgi:hypothetical protein
LFFLRLLREPRPAPHGRAPDPRPPHARVHARGRECGRGGRWQRPDRSCAQHDPDTPLRHLDNSAGHAVATCSRRQNHSHTWSITSMNITDGGWW